MEELKVGEIEKDDYPDHIEERIESQELHCHACGKYVQFRLDMNMNGAHVLNCPNCDHEHCRVVKDGKITNDRWDQRNGNQRMFTISGATTSASSTFTTYQGTATGTGNYLLYQSWADTGTGGASKKVY